MATAEDPEILKRCCAEDRMLVTADKKLTKFLASSGSDCPSVLILRDLRTRRPAELGDLVVANLSRIAAVAEREGHAVFVMAPGKPIRAVTLPLT